MNAEPKPAKRTRLQRRLISGLWFLAIMGTLAIAAARPYIGFLVGLGVIGLSIVFPAEGDCAAPKSGKSK